MAKNQGIPSTPVEHMALLKLCQAKDDNLTTPPEYNFLIPEKTALTTAATDVFTGYGEWKTRSDEYGLLTAQWTTLEKDALDLIGRTRSFWCMRFSEGNTYEHTAGIDETPRKKSRVSQALADIVTVSTDNIGTPAELPVTLITSLSDLHTLTSANLQGTAIARGEKQDSYQEIKSAILNEGMTALRACREYLFVVLPNGKHDQLLIEWGFEPWDYPTHEKPAAQAFVQTTYDPATDIATLRLTEDLLATEYIIEYAMTPSPAPQGWIPQAFVELTEQNEPYLETDPLTEKMTYAFRGRAHNSAGYGGYTDLWIVEVV
jgi:hypothetical protein